MTAQFIFLPAVSESSSFSVLANTGCNFNCSYANIGKVLMYISLMANDEHFFHVFIGHSYINGEMFFAYFLIELFSILLFKLRTFEVQKYYYS